MGSVGRVFFLCGGVGGEWVVGLDQGLKGWGGVMSPASGGEVTNCCANYAEPSRPQQWEPD